MYRHEVSQSDRSNIPSLQPNEGLRRRLRQKYHDVCSIPLRYNQLVSLDNLSTLVLVNNVGGSGQES